MSFQIDILGSINNHDVEYFPNGISTLGLLIKNNDMNNTHQVVIRPSNRKIPPLFYAIETTKNGQRIGNKSDLKIIWGSGEENGYNVTLSPNGQAKVFFSILNESSDLNEYTFEMEVIQKDALDDDNMNKNVPFLKTVRLIPPNNISPDKLYGMKKRFESVNSRTIEFSGNKIAAYKSRWFDLMKDYAFQSFNEKSNVPKIKIAFNEYGEFVSGDIKINLLKSKNEYEPIAVIAEDTERSIIHAEMFHFIENYYVLRIWLYWITTEFNGNWFIGETAGEQSTTETTDLRAVKKWMVEAPDIERFDLVLDMESEKIRYIGTDLHWRETWWETKGDVANLGFANKRLFLELVKNIPQLLKLDQVFQNPSELLKQDIVNKSNPAADGSWPFKKFIEEIRNDGDFSEHAYSDNIVLGHGVHRKHVPYLSNTFLMPKYTSMDVTSL